MRFINRERCSGKTSMLIHTAYVTGMPIVVSNYSRVKHICDAAERMGLGVIDVYSADEFINNKMSDYYKEILLDESTDFIYKALDDYFGCHVVAGTMSVPMDKLPSDEK